MGASDAYPILLVNAMNSQRGASGFAFVIKNEFEYPIYDVEINVFDFQFTISHSTREGDKYVISRSDFAKSIMFQKDYSQIFANSDIITPEFYQMTDGILYVKLKCRGSFVFEKIAFVTIDNTVHYGYVVYDERGVTLKTWYTENSSEDAKRAMREKFKLIPASVKMTFIN
jgi:hypothetical protein